MTPTMRRMRTSWMRALVSPSSTTSSRLTSLKLTRCQPCMWTGITCRVLTGRTLSFWTSWSLSMEGSSLTSGWPWLTFWLKMNSRYRTPGTSLVSTICRLSTKSETWKPTVLAESCPYKAQWRERQRWSQSCCLASSGASSAMPQCREWSRNSDSPSQPSVRMNAVWATSSSWKTQALSSWIGRRSDFRSCLWIYQLVQFPGPSMSFWEAIQSIRLSQETEPSSQEPLWWFQMSSSWWNQERNSRHPMQTTAECREMTMLLAPWMDSMDFNAQESKTWVSRWSSWLEQSLPKTRDSDSRP